MQNFLQTNIPKPSVLILKARASGLLMLIYILLNAVLLETENGKDSISCTGRSGCNTEACSVYSLWATQAILK